MLAFTSLTIFYSRWALAFLSTSLHAWSLCISAVLIYRVFPSNTMLLVAFLLSRCTRIHLLLCFLVHERDWWSGAWTYSTEVCEKEPVLTCTSSIAKHHPDIKGKKRWTYTGNFSLRLSLVFTWLKEALIILFWPSGHLNAICSCIHCILPVPSMGIICSKEARKLFSFIVSKFQSFFN